MRDTISVCGAARTRTIRRLLAASALVAVVGFGSVAAQDRYPPSDSPTLLRAIELRFPTRGERSLRDPVTYIREANFPEYVSRPSLDRWVPYDSTQARLVADAERLWQSGQFESLWVDVRDDTWGNGVAGKRVIFSLVERRYLLIPTTAYPTPPPDYRQPPVGHERLYPPPEG